MRSFAVVAAVAGLAAAHGPAGSWPQGGAASSGWGAPVYVTDVVTAYTTYCPSATMITHGASTYTVTEATTLTITNCPCTITRPVSSVAPSSAPVMSSKPAASTGVPPVAPVSSTYVVPKPSVSASASATSAAPVTSYTGAASKVQVAGGMLAALGLVAAAL